MKIEPLSKDIYNKCKEYGITKIVLHWSGGSDEGLVDVETDSKDNYLSKEIEDWAYEAYEYNGAGDGTDYGDDITYDLKEGTVSHEEWFYTPQRVSNKPTKLKVAKN
jgi:hypothetical protein